MTKIYNRFARYPQLPFIMAELAFKGYKDLNPLLISIDNTLTVYVSKKDIKKANLSILNILKNKNFKNTVDGFYADIKSINSNILNILKKQELNKIDFKYCINGIIKINSIYSLTEHYYTDYAYSLSKSNKLLSLNLNLFGKFKNKSRLIVNNLLLSDESLLLSLLYKISLKYNITIENLMYYSVKEILSLFDNKKVISSKIRKRQNAYLIMKNKTFDGKKEVKLILNKFNFEEIIHTEIKGTSVNKGVSKGKVKKYVETVGNYEKEISNYIKSVNKGDIIVAETTIPVLLPALKKANGIVTAEGGLLSHAAIISRELNIPCIVGIGNNIDKLKNNDLIEVDANKGIVRIIKRGKSK